MAGSQRVHSWISVCVHMKLPGSSLVDLWVLSFQKKPPSLSPRLCVAAAPWCNLLRACLLSSFKSCFSLPTPLTHKPWATSRWPYQGWDQTHHTHSFWAVFKIEYALHYTGWTSRSSACSRCLCAHPSWQPRVDCTELFNFNSNNLFGVKQLQHTGPPPRPNSCITCSSLVTYVHIIIAHCAESMMVGLWMVVRADEVPQISSETSGEREPSGSRRVSCLVLPSHPHLPAALLPGFWLGNRRVWVPAVGTGSWRVASLTSLANIHTIKTETVILLPIWLKNIYLTCSRVSYQAFKRSRK